MKQYSIKNSNLKSSFFRLFVNKANNNFRTIRALVEDHDKLTGETEDAAAKVTSDVKTDVKNEPEKVPETSTGTGVIKSALDTGADFKDVPESEKKGLGKVVENTDEKISTDAFSASGIGSFINLKNMKMIFDKFEIRNGQVLLCLEQIIEWFDQNGKSYFMPNTNCPNVILEENLLPLCDKGKVVTNLSTVMQRELTNHRTRSISVHSSRNLNSINNLSSQEKKKVIKPVFVNMTNELPFDISDMIGKQPNNYHTDGIIFKICEAIRNIQIVEHTNGVFAHIIASTLRKPIKVIQLSSDPKIQNEQLTKGSNNNFLTFFHLGDSSNSLINLAYFCSLLYSPVIPYINLNLGGYQLINDLTNWSSGIGSQIVIYTTRKDEVDDIISGLTPNDFITESSMVSLAGTLSDLSNTKVNLSQFKECYEQTFIRLTGKSETQHCMILQLPPFFGIFETVASRDESSSDKAILYDLFDKQLFALNNFKRFKILNLTQSIFYNSANSAADSLSLAGERVDTIIRVLRNKLTYNLQNDSFTDELLRASGYNTIFEFEDMFMESFLDETSLYQISIKSQTTGFISIMFNRPFSMFTFCNLTDNYYIKDNISAVISGVTPIEVIEDQSDGMIGYASTAAAAAAEYLFDTNVSNLLNTFNKKNIELTGIIPENSILKLGSIFVLQKFLSTGKIYCKMTTKSATTTFNQPAKTFISQTPASTPIRIVLGAPDMSKLINASNDQLTKVNLEARDQDQFNELYGGKNINNVLEQNNNNNLKQNNQHKENINVNGTIQNDKVLNEELKIIKSDIKETLNKNEYKKKKNIYNNKPILKNNLNQTIISECLNKGIYNFKDNYLIPLNNENNELIVNNLKRLFTKETHLGNKCVKQFLDEYYGSFYKFGKIKTSQIKIFQILGIGFYVVRFNEENLRVEGLIEIIELFYNKPEFILFKTDTGRIFFANNKFLELLFNNLYKNMFIEYQHKENFHITNISGELNIRRIWYLCLIKGKDVAYSFKLLMNKHLIE